MTVAAIVIATALMAIVVVRFHYKGGVEWWRFWLIQILIGLLIPGEPATAWMLIAIGCLAMELITTPGKGDGE